MAQTTRVTDEPTSAPTFRPGPLGRLGIWVTSHRKIVTLAWALLVSSASAPSPRAVERRLSGAGWQADGSESVAVRELVQRHFGGRAAHAIQVVVHSDGSAR